MVTINIYIFIILLWCLQMFTVLIFGLSSKGKLVDNSIELFRKVKSEKIDTGVEYITPEEEYQRDLYE